MTGVPVAYAERELPARWPLTSIQVLATGVLGRGDQPLLGPDLTPSQRLRLITGMMAACSEKGYATLTVADVVSAARVSRQTFYEHFPSKEACFLAAQALGHRITLNHVFQAAAGEDWEADLSRGLHAYLELMAAEPEMMHTTIVESLGAGPAALSAREEAFGRFAELLEGLQEQRRALDPEVPPLERTLSIAVIAGLNELALMHLRAGRAQDLPRIHEFAVVFARSVMCTTLLPGPAEGPHT